MASLDGQKTIREVAAELAAENSDDTKVDDARAVKICQWLVQNNLVYGHDVRQQQTPRRASENGAPCKNDGTAQSDFMQDPVVQSKPLSDMDPAIHTVGFFALVARNLVDDRRIRVNDFVQQLGQSSRCLNWNFFR